MFSTQRIKFWWTWVYTFRVGGCLLLSKPSKTVPGVEQIEWFLPAWDRGRVFTTSHVQLSNSKQEQSCEVRSINSHCRKSVNMTASNLLGILSPASCPHRLSCAVLRTKVLPSWEEGSCWLVALGQEEWRPKAWKTRAGLWGEADIGTLCEGVAFVSEKKF